SLTAVAPAQHLSLAEQTGEPRRRYSPSAPEWPGPWQTPQFAILNHAAIDSGIPRESATQRLGISQYRSAELTVSSSTVITGVAGRGPLPHQHKGVCYAFSLDRNPDHCRHRCDLFLGHR